MFVWLSLAFASPLPQGPEGPPPPLHAWILDHAEVLGLSTDTVEGLEAVGRGAREEVEGAHAELRAAHTALRALMEAPSPDRARVLAASAALGDAEQQARDLHLNVELDLRALLTPAQWEQVRAARPKPPRPPGRP